MTVTLTNFIVFLSGLVTMLILVKGFKFVKEVVFPPPKYSYVIKTPKGPIKYRDKIKFKRKATDFKGVVIGTEVGRRDTVLVLARYKGDVFKINLEKDYWEVVI